MVGIFRGLKKIHKFNYLWFIVEKRDLNDSINSISTLPYTDFALWQKVLFVPKQIIIFLHFISFNYQCIRPAEE